MSFTSFSVFFRRLEPDHHRNDEAPLISESEDATTLVNEIYCMDQALSNTARGLAKSHMKQSMGVNKGDSSSDDDSNSL